MSHLNYLLCVINLLPASHGCCLPLTGYEDSRKQNSDVAPLEITRINKSIYALQNVMYALNANESHVPYRESKLTRMLKDCFRGCNRTLLITCLVDTLLAVELFEVYASMNAIANRLFFFVLSPGNIAKTHFTC